MSLEPKDCTHAIGIIQSIQEGSILLDRDDFDLLEESNAVAFNYCPWCGISLIERDFTEVNDGLSEAID